MNSPTRTQRTLFLFAVGFTAVLISVFALQRRSGTGVEPVDSEKSAQSDDAELAAVTSQLTESEERRQDSRPTEVQAGVLTIHSRGFRQHEGQIIWLARDTVSPSESRVSLAVTEDSQSFTLAPGSYRVEQGQFECLRNAFELEVDGEARLDVVWKRELEIEVLRADATPAAGAPVRFRRIPGGASGSDVEATTDALGRCTISCLALPGRVLAGAPRIGFAHQLIPSETPDDPVVLWLDAGPIPMQSLVLVDATGAPMSNVACTGNHGESLGDTDEEGTVALPFSAARRSRLELTLRGEAAYPSWCTLPPDDGPVTVPRSVPVKVTVRGAPTGTPIDISVQLDRSGSANHANPNPVQAARRVVGSEGVLNCPEGILTTIHVVDGDGRSGVASILPVVDSPQHLQIDLAPSPQLQLRFARGAPPHTSIETSLDSFGSSVLQVDTGAMSLDLPVPASTLRVTVRAPGHVPRAFIPVGGTASGGEIDATLVEGRAVAFAVVDPLDGEPVANVRLDINNRDRVWIGGDGESGLQTLDPGWREHAPRMVSVFTGPNGVGRAPALEPGHYGVSLRLSEEAFAWFGAGRGYSAPPTEVRIASDESEVVIEMPRPRLVSIQAIDAATGRPLSEFQVVDVDEPTRRWTALSGTAHLPIPSTTRELRIHASEYRAVVIAAPETSRRETVSLLRRAGACVQVTATSGQSLEGTRILLDVWSFEGPGQQGEPQLLETVRTTLGRTGRAEFECHFDPATMRLAARLGSRQDALELRDSGRRFYWDGASDVALKLDVRDGQ